MAKILIVDDEPLTCRCLEEFFTGKGYKVLTATRGEEALSKLNSERPLLMLLDVRMPGMDGMEILARAKALNPRLGVILITGVLDEETGRRALGMGADDYLTKPIDLNYLEMSVWVKVLALTGN